MEVLQDTYKDTKIGKIPKDWNTLKINQIADCYGGTTPSTVVEEYWNGDILWATPSDITKNKSEYLLNTSRKITEQGRASKNLRFVKKNGLLMTSRASIGFLNISNGDVVTNQGFINIECKDNFHYKFFYYWVLDNRKKLLSLSQGSTFLELYRKTFSKINIPAPPLPEQQKIAAILSTVDEQISTTDRIIEKSKELKKGLMQKLFSEGIGHTEFKDTKIGRIPKDWEVKKVGDICKLQGGFAFKSSDATESGIRWFKIANVGVNRVKWDAESFLPLGFEKKHPDFVLNEGDIVVAMTRPVLSGKLKICTIMKSDSGSLLNQRVGRVRLIDNNDSVYYYQSFNTKRFIDSVEGELFGTDPPNISSKLFENIKIPFPPKQERTKIAAILSEVDAKIEKEQTQKTHLQALKKGLMQQLLTGKKRVKV